MQSSLIAAQKVSGSFHSSFLLLSVGLMRGLLVVQSSCTGPLLIIVGHHRYFQLGLGRSWPSWLGPPSSRWDRRSFGKVVLLGTIAGRIG